MILESPIIRSVWTARLFGPDRQLLDEYTVQNMILNSGRRDATMALIGLRPPGVYKWVGIGSSSVRESVGQPGVVTPLRVFGQPFRAMGDWSSSGTDFALDLAIPGTTVAGSVREAALYAAQYGGFALYRIVLPASLPLTAFNTLTVSITLSP